MLVTPFPHWPMTAYRHKKSLGQHFLHDPGYLARIVTAIRPAADDLMVEIYLDLVAHLSQAFPP